MVPVRSLLLIALLFLSGCVFLPGHSRPDALLPPTHPYISQVETPDASALYHFAEASLMLSEGDYDGAEENLLGAIEADPLSAELRLTLSGLYASAGQIEKAVRAAEDALAQDPDDADAHFHLAGLYFSQQRDSEAVEHYQRVIELTPDRENAYLHLGISSARMGDMERAVEVLKELLKRKPDSLLADLALARIYRELGLNLLAEDSYRRVLSKKRPGFESVYLEMGDMYESKGENERALELYRSGLDSFQESSILRQQIVRLLILLNRLDEAAEELSVLLEENPDNLEALRRLGLIRLQEGDWAASVEIFSDLHERLPDSDQVRFYYGTALEGIRDFEGALQAFRDISTESDFYPDALSHLAYLYHQLKRPEEAVLLLRKRLDNPANPPEFFAYLSSLHLAMSQFLQAHEVLDRGLLLHGENLELIYRKALLFDQQGERDQALETMNRLLQLDPENAEALNYLAYTYAEIGVNLQGALEMALKAISLKEEPHIFDTLGWVYFKLQRFEDARREMERAADSLSDDPVVLEHLGDIYNALALFDQAREAYEKAGALAPDNVLIQQKIETLSEVDR